MTKIAVVINCQSKSKIHPELIQTLQNQSHPFDLIYQISQSFPKRLALALQLSHEVIFFVDQDIILSSSDFIKINSDFLISIDKPTLLTGFCINDHTLNYFQKSYNWIINTWMHGRWYGNEEILECENAAGGIWILKKQDLRNMQDWSEPEFWGGEDTQTVRYLQTKNFKILRHPKCDIFHKPNSDFFHFIRRAFIQGQALSRWNLRSRNRKWPIFEFSFNFFLVIPAVALHHLSLIIGFIFEKTQSVKPNNRPTQPPKR